MNGFYLLYISFRKNSILIFLAQLQVASCKRQAASGNCRIRVDSYSQKKRFLLLLLFMLDFYMRKAYQMQNFCRKRQNIRINCEKYLKFNELCGIVKEPNIQLHIFPLPEVCILSIGKNTSSRFSCFGLWKLDVWRQLELCIFRCDSFGCRTFCFARKEVMFFLYFIKKQ